MGMEKSRRQLCRHCLLDQSGPAIDLAWAWIAVCGHVDESTTYSMLIFTTRPEGVRGNGGAVHGMVTGSSIVECLVEPKMAVQVER